ncbi:MAG: glycosyltransferase family 2 protein, partial [Bacteroidota bacterium]
MISTLSIIIPCYNEESLIPVILQKLISVNAGGLAKEIIIVDDGSSDNTAIAIQQFANTHSEARIVFLQNKKNEGKGASIKAALEHVTGNITIIQDADLEYDPSDYNRLLKPILDGYADVVYGSRFRGSEPHRVLFFFHTIGNKFLTFLSNLLTQLNLTDMETGY